MKGLVALVFVLGVAFVGIRIYEQKSQEIVLERPTNYAAAKTVEMSSQRDLFAELEMKLPPGMGTGSEIQASDVAPQVALDTSEAPTVSKQITRKHRRHHRRSRHHRRRH